MRRGLLDQGEQPMGLMGGLTNAFENPMMLGGLSLLSGGGWGGAMQGMRTGAGLQDRRREQEQQAQQQQQFRSALDALGEMPPAERALLEAAGVNSAPAYLKHLMDQRDPSKALDAEYKRAQIAKLQRDATAGPAAPDFGKSGSIFQGPDGKFYGVQFGSDGSQRVAPIETGGEALTPARGVQVVGDQVIDSATGGAVRNVGQHLAAGEASKATGSATVKAGVDAWESYGKLQTNISNLDEAIAALDSGAASGIVYNMLPNVTEASASLKNAMDRMGLDVIGSVTFGALSEGEMRLAMETAVPRSLAPKELRNWLVKKRDAQQKAAAMLSDAAQFLTTPGNTINDWIERNRAAKSGGGSESKTQRLRFNPETGALE